MTRVYGNALYLVFELHKHFVFDRTVDDVAKFDATKQHIDAARI